MENNDKSILEQMLESMTQIHGKGKSPTNEEAAANSQIRKTLMDLTEVWPDFVSAWNGMIEIAIRDGGWTPEVARSIVLNTIIPDATHLMVTHRHLTGEGQ